MAKNNDEFKVLKPSGEDELVEVKPAKITEPGFVTFKMKNVYGQIVEITNKKWFYEKMKKDGLVIE